MNPISFPKQIRDYFQEHPNETDDENTQLIKIFQDNVGAKEEFLSWAQAHTSVVERTPRLYHTLELVDSSGWQATAARIKQSFWLPADKSLDLINRVLAHKDKIGIEADIPFEYASTVMGLFESGIINEKQVVALLSIQDERGHTPLSNPKVFQATIPLLKSLDSNVLAAILSIKDGQGDPLLSIENLFPFTIPLLEKLGTDDIVALFSLKGRGGDILLSNPKVFQAAIPCLKTLDSNVLTAILSIKDGQGEPLLSIESLFPFTIPLLEKLGTDDLVALLSLKGKGGDILLSNPKVLQAVIPFLETLDSNVLAAILSIKDRYGDSLLHRENLFKLTVPLLEKLETHEQVALLSIQDNKGLMPLSRSDVFRAAIPLLTLDPNAFKDLLFIKGGNTYTYSGGELTPLNSLKSNIEEAIPLLNKMDPADLFKIFSGQDATRSTLLNMLTAKGTPICEFAFPVLLRKLDLEDLVKLLSLGNPLITMNRQFEHAIPLLETLDSNTLKRILSVQVGDGWTVFHNGHLFELAIPLLQKLDTNDLVDLLSIRNKWGKTPLDDELVLGVAIPFLKTLDSKDLVAILSIRGWMLEFLFSKPKVAPLLELLSQDQVQQLKSLKEDEKRFEPEVWEDGKRQI